MISGLDIYRAANLLIRQHGADARIEASRMIDRMFELGYAEGLALWRRIGNAVEVLQAPPGRLLH